MCVALLLCIPSAGQQTAETQAPGQYDIDYKHKSVLEYGIEWRLIRAGTARLTWSPAASGYQGDLHLESTGLVSKLHKVDDDYNVVLRDNLCTRSVYLDAQEGKRHRETRINFDQSGKATYNERDVLKNTVLLSKEIQTPACVYDYVGGLNRLRSYKLEPGQSVLIPMSDGKKFANVKVEAQEREQVKTPLGTFTAMRYEVGLFNDVIVNKKARLFVWLTEDSRRLPVQIRVRMQFLIGTITLQLEKTSATESAATTSSR